MWSGLTPNVAIQALLGMPNPAVRMVLIMKPTSWPFISATKQAPSSRRA